ncbi:MAG: nucleotide excision repair endonuclease, partial [Limisphaerales bacterium]
LYVGHSRNLRLRLSYYKNAQPEREPKRIVRLVHQVRQIEMECCDTVDAAQVRELALIRQLRPRFNVANTVSATYSYFGFRERSAGFALRLSMSEARMEGESVVGGFKSRGLCARAFLALARTILSTEMEPQSIYDFPAWLNTRARGWEFNAHWRTMVGDLLEGKDQSLLGETTRLVTRASDTFLRQIFESDLITLSEFFELAQEMARLRRLRATAVLSQEALQVSGRLCRNAHPGAASITL